MSVSYRVLLRLFGTHEAMNEARRLLYAMEAEYPGYSFSVELLPMSNAPQNTHGLEIRGERNRAMPGFASVDYQAPPFSEMPSLIVERLFEADDRQTHEVFQGGKRLYFAEREEATGDVHPLGAPGLQYNYSSEEGLKDAFCFALKLAGVTHRLHSL